MIDERDGGERERERMDRQTETYIDDKYIDT